MSQPPAGPADPAPLRDLVRSELAPALTDGAVTTDPDVLAAYATDQALFCPAGTPLVLVRARTIADVQTSMRFAAAHRVPVVPQGARSGLSGGANAVAGCLLLSLERMTTILSIDPAERTAIVEPGVVNLDLKKALAPHGLSYPPDPGSVGISTIGGNVATNAGGLCCVKYGVTRDYVRQLTVVLAEGTLATLGPATAKGVAGLDLRGLFVGSEGTLGVIVQIMLRLVPALPEPVTAVATFDDERSAAAAVAAFMASGAQPCLLELMDRVTLQLLGQLGNVGLGDAGAMLLMQSDGGSSPDAARAEAAAFLACAQASGAADTAISDDAAEGESLIATRRLVQPAFEKYSRGHGGGQLIDDICLPRSAMPQFFDDLTAIRAESGLTIGAVAHAGDGNIHPTILFDAHDPDETARAESTFDAIMQTGLDLGGTITGEHGVGYLKRSWLPRELDDGARLLHRRVKQALDPDGILNPGKMFAEL